MNILRQVLEKTGNHLQYYIDKHSFDIQLVGLSAQEAEDQLDDETKVVILNNILSLKWNDKDFDASIKRTLNQMRWHRIRRSIHTVIGEELLLGSNWHQYKQQILLAWKVWLNPVAYIKTEDQFFPSLIVFNKAFRDKHEWLICTMHWWKYTNWVQRVDRNVLNNYTALDISIADILGINTKLYHSLTFIQLIQWDLINKLN